MFEPYPACFQRGLWSDRHGVIERDPTLAFSRTFIDPGDLLSIGVVTGPLIGFQKDPLRLVATVSARRPGALHLAQGRRARFCYLSRLSL